MSTKAMTLSSSYTLLQGISPRTILPNMVSDIAILASAWCARGHCPSDRWYGAKAFMSSAARRVNSAARCSARRSWRMRQEIRLSAVLAVLTAWTVAAAADYPPPVEGDYLLKDFRFASGETLPELHIHYRTFGHPRTDGQG